MLRRVGRVSLSPSRDPLEAFGISLEREIDSVGLVKVEGGLFDATELDSWLEDIATKQMLDAWVSATKY
jgi:hypothetical protein